MVEEIPVAAHEVLVIAARASVGNLLQKFDKVAHSANVSGEIVPLWVAARALESSIPWGHIAAAIADGLLPVTKLKLAGPLGERFGISILSHLSDVIAQEKVTFRRRPPRWVGQTGAAEILGTNVPAVFKLEGIGLLTRHVEAPAHHPFLSTEVESLSREIIFTPEVVRLGSFACARQATAWLASRGLAHTALKKNGWEFYKRGDVKRR